jgi:hypothetical protein
MPSCPEESVLSLVEFDNIIVMTASIINDGKYVTCPGGSCRFIPGTLPLSKESAMRAQEMLANKKHNAEQAKMYAYYEHAAGQLLHRMQRNQPLVQVLLQNFQCVLPDTMVHAPQYPAVCSSQR